MIRLRMYTDADARHIVMWQSDERSFYQWSAGMLGAYPLTEAALARTDGLMRLVAVDGDDVAGFFTLRYPADTRAEVRFGYVIVDPQRRGRGLGAEMLRAGLRFARAVCKAEVASLSVFENNEPAYRCYKAVGFTETGEREDYPVMGEVWPCRVMRIDLTALL